MQCFCGTDLRAFVTEDALRSIFSFAGFFVDLHVHGADPQTLPAVDAFALIAVDAQQGEIAHGLEKNRNRAQVFAERPIIFESEG